jgi:hypothetical protein
MDDVTASDMPPGMAIADLQRGVWCVIIMSRE